MKKEKKCEPSDFVRLAGTILGIFLAVVVIVLVFAPLQAVPLISSVVWGFVVLGIVLGAFQYKVLKKK